MQPIGSPIQTAPTAPAKDAALKEAGLPVSVATVIESKRRGLVAKLVATSDVSDEDVTKVLGAFIRPWDWAE